MAMLKCFATDRDRERHIDRLKTDDAPKRHYGNT